MAATIYKQTATKAKGSKLNTWLAFGREETQHGLDKSDGGYAVFILKDRFVGSGGDLHRTWELVQDGLGYADAVKMLNKKAKYKAFLEPTA